MNISLRPCPFCGSEDIRVDPDANDRKCVWLTCRNCGIETRVFDTIKEAYSFWNKRYLDDDGK